MNKTRHVIFIKSTPTRYKVELWETIGLPSNPNYTEGLIKVYRHKLITKIISKASVWAQVYKATIYSEVT